MNKKFNSYSVLLCSLFLTAFLFSYSPVSAQSEQEIIDSVNAIVSQQLEKEKIPAPPTNVEAIDKPNDGGGSVLINWTVSDDDAYIKGYIISRSESEQGPFHDISESVQGSNSYTDNKAVEGVTYYYQVKSYKDVLDLTNEIQRITSPAISTGPIASTAQWFNTDRAWCLFFVLIISAAIIIFIEKAKKGGSVYVRKIAGIDAVDEAVGRATEMGRKIFYIPGIQDMNDVQTIAGIAILGRVGQLAATYETWLEVPVSKSLVMVTARETLKEAYTQVGRPDSFQEAQVHYLTDDQFGYAAAIDGMVVREKPATIFYMGAFFAESLILAETGNAAGAIQIAGTAMPSQLPFFVASCDYTLIGEELFAASAYLSKEPRQLGSLKGQDVGKAIFMAAIILGVIFETFGIWNLSQIFLVK